MYNLRNELIKTIIKSLKIDDNPFNVITIQDMIKNINDNNLQEFYQALFGNEHSFLNGLDRVAKIAERFKPIDSTQSNIELKAKELIQWCESANATIFDGAKKSGNTFDDEMNHTGFIRLINESETMAILNAVKPYCDYKELITNIRAYQTSKEALSAFVSALKYTPMDSNLIANSMKNLRIKR